MNETKHTQGPWTYATHQGHTLVETVEPAKTVCNVYGNTTDAKEANARLIAAAPEMLEALKAVTDSNINRPDLVPMWKKVYDAIAKAEGRA